MAKTMREHTCLSEYEAKIYFSLLKEGPSTARRLSMISDVPRTKIYGTLKKLIDRGLVIKIPENPTRFASLSPTDAFKPILRLYEKKTRDLQLTLSFLEKVYAETNGTMRARREEVWILMGRREILRRTFEILSRVDKSVDLLATENGLILLYKAYNKLLDKLIENGVKVQITVPSSSRRLGIVQELRYLCKFRYIDASPSILFVGSDGREFLLAKLLPDNFDSSSDKDVGFFIQSPILYSLISSFFFSIKNILDHG